MSQNILYSEKDHERVPNLFTVQINFMMAMAQIRPKIIFGELVSYCFCFVMALLTFHLAILYSKTTYDSLLAGELEDITDALTLTIIYWFSFFATCYWLARSQSLKEFLDDINRNYRHHSLAGLTYVSAFRSYRLARALTLYWQFFCILGVVLWGLAPIILQVRSLPLKCWYPFDQMRPVIYEITYVVQLFAQINIGATFGNGSALYVSLIIVMLGQFDVLYCSLKNFHYHAMLIAGASPTKLRELQESLPIGETSDELNQYQFLNEIKVNLGIYRKRPHIWHITEQRKIALTCAFRKCIEHHLFVTRSCRKLEQLFSPYCLIKSIQITFQLCLLVFVGVAGEKSAVRSVNLIQYLALTSCELLMFTYFGELIRIHSMRGGEALMRSPWFMNMTLIRNDILIFLENTKRPVQLTAGKFFIMDVQRFRSVVTQAFSFLTLLQNLAAKN